MWIQANWPAARHIHAVTTTRVGGFSLAPYDSLNLAMHVGDKPELVEKNRCKVTKALSMPSVPIWLHQVHGSVARVGCGEFANRISREQ